MPYSNLRYGQEQKINKSYMKGKKRMEIDQVKVNCCTQMVFIMKEDLLRTLSMGWVQ